MSMDKVKVLTEDWEKMIIEVYDQYPMVIAEITNEGVNCYANIGIKLIPAADKTYDLDEIDDACLVEDEEE